MAEPIVFICSKCKEEVSVDAALSGFNIACPHCDATIMVPVVPVAVPGERKKIQIKKSDEPGHLKVEDPEASGASDAIDEPDEEIEYIEIVEAPPRWRNGLIAAIAVIVMLGAFAAIFFEAKSYFDEKAARKAAVEKAQAEATAAAAELAAKEQRLQPVWDDAMALSERVRKQRSGVDNAIAVFDGLKSKDFAGTKFEGLADEQLKALASLKAELSEEQRKAQEAAAAAAAAKAQAAPQPAQKPASAQPAPQALSAAQQAAQKKAAEEKQAATLKALSKLALKGDWKAAAGMLESYPDKEMVASLKPAFEAASNIDAIAAETLKADEGKELAVSLKTGTETFKIISVRNGVVQASQKFERATIQKSFKDSDLSQAERVSRLGRSNPEAAALVQASIDYAREEPDDAIRALDAVRSSKSALFASLREIVRKELVESLAEDEFEKLLGRFRLKPSQSPAEIQGEVSKTKAITQANKDEWKGFVDRFVSHYKDTAYFKSVAPKVDALQKGVASIQVSASAKQASTTLQNNLGGKPSGIGKIGGVSK